MWIVIVGACMLTCCEGAGGWCSCRESDPQDGDERKMSRPFGVALLLAGYDDKGPQLFFSDPSGTFTQFKAKAIGALRACGGVSYCDLVVKRSVRVSCLRID